MEPTLIIGEYAYSSWSLRGWLFFDRFGLRVRTRRVSFDDDPSVAEQLADTPPAATVPVLVLEDGTPVWDSLAIAEELATRHPDAGHWPTDGATRAVARSLSAEMHSSYTALRSEHPMALRVAYRDAPVGGDVRAELARVERIWSYALDRFGGPWLCGEYSVADAMFAPVAARIATYGLPVGKIAQAYAARHLDDPSFRRWRAMGLAHGGDLPWYARDFAQGEWPGPPPRPARIVEAGSAVNERCPYSGKPVTHFMECDGRIWGFCNIFCRNKTLADPDAWPAFAALL